MKTRKNNCEAMNFNLLTALKVHFLHTAYTSVCTPCVKPEGGQTKKSCAPGGMLTHSLRFFAYTSMNLSCTAATFTETFSSLCHSSVIAIQAETGRAGHLWFGNMQLKDKMPLG